MTNCVADFNARVIRSGYFAILHKADPSAWVVTDIEIAPKKLIYNYPAVAHSLKKYAPSSCRQFIFAGSAVLKSTRDPIGAMNPSNEINCRVRTMIRYSAINTVNSVGECEWMVPDTGNMFNDLQQDVCESFKLAKNDVIVNLGEFNP